MRTFLRYGMVGGGQGAFIGDVHRKGAEFDSKSILSAGSFSRDFENTKITGRMLRVAEDRLYRSYEEMAEKESSRDDGIDYVIIVTPNHLHYSVSKAFLEKGIHVVCDKPLTFEVAEAEELAGIAEKNGLLYCVTYGNPGYPMVKQAREMVRNGEIGEIRMIMAEYPQAWLVDLVEKTGLKVAWRTDPKYAGKSTCVADIGTHAENLVSYITGLKMEALSAKLDVFGEGRTLDTNASILAKYENGASGMFWASQVAVGYDNALKVRIVGSEASLEWEQEHPNEMKVTFKNKPSQIYSKGSGYLSDSALVYNWTPPGHPDGTVEAFANIYKAFSNHLLKKLNGENPDDFDTDYPNIYDGIQGVRFVDLCVESSRDGSRWVKV